MCYVLKEEYIRYFLTKILHSVREMKAKALREVTWYKTDDNKVWNCVVKTMRARGV